MLTWQHVLAGALRLLITHSRTCVSVRLQLEDACLARRCLHVCAAALPVHPVHLQASKRHSGLAAERAAYDAAVAERDSFVRDTTARLALHGVGSTAGLGGEGTLPDSTIRAFEQSLGQYVSQAEKALRDAKALSRYLHTHTRTHTHIHTHTHGQTIPPTAALTCA